jgi:MscS family membrane protein
VSRALRLADTVVFAIAVVFATGASAAETPPTEQAPVESLAGGNPREAVYRYMKEARRANWTDAARVLDLSEIPESERASRGPALARELKVVLDRTIWIDLDQLSDRPGGTPTEGLPDDVERIGTITTSSGPVDITLRRARDPEAGGRHVWKFSPVLIERLPELYDEFRYGWIGSHVPHVLQTMGPSNLEKWQLLGLAALLVVAWLAAWLFTKGLTRALSPPVLRTRTLVDNRLLKVLSRPVRWTLALAIVWGSLPALDITASASGWIRRGLFAFGFVTLMLYVAAAAEGFAQATREKFAREGQTSGAGVVDIAMRLVKIVLVVIGVTGLLQLFGFNVTTIIAGLGIGGIAVALAAQKTIENLFGGLTLMADRPVRIGDYCRFGTQEGWVEDIGLRSTRVRTPARTVISIPNSVFSSVDIENLTSRDRMRFFTTLNLRYETTPEQMREVLVQLRALLDAHPRVGPELLRVRFAALGASSLDIEINAYVLTASVDEFLEIRETLLLRFMEVVSKAGTGFAFPSQTLYMTRDQGRGSGGTGRAIPQA